MPSSSSAKSASLASAALSSASSASSVASMEGSTASTQQLFLKIPDEENPNVASPLHWNRFHFI